MKSMNNILTLALLATTLVAAQPLSAQVKLSDDAYPAIIAPHQQTVSYRERTLCFELTANVPFTATPTADWITVRQGDNGTVYIHLKKNPDTSGRVGTVVFANEEKGLSETLTINQGRDESINDLPSDEQIQVASAKANNSESGYGISYTYDNKLNTYWHTGWTKYFEVSATNPAILTYNFNNVEHIDYVNYITRQDNSINGNFKEVEVYAQCADETELKLITSVDLGGTSGTHRIDLGSTGLDDPKVIEFKVLSGASSASGLSYASCAEMQFFKDNRKGLFDVFADEAMTTLKEGTTQADIDAIEDPFVQEFARKLLDGSYETKYRVGEYTAKLSPSVQAEMWNAPGKYYDQIQGVTGISIPKGKQAIAVSGLPEGGSVPMRVTAWYVGKVGNSFDGGNPESQNFTLTNGLNIIDYTGSYDGLAYICYYADVNPEAQPKIKVHFINGQVNGYLSLDQTNEEMHELVGKAPNYCMDVVGEQVHSVWTKNGIDGKYSKGLYGACLADDGVSLGYRQYIHVLDSLVIWEHNLLGFKKYNRLPDNRTMAYVNFTYYMFQGGNGVSFHVNQENRVLNCKTLIKNDNDAIWGLSHEWGHQHQMHPYFCWAGMGEVTNNMNSYYNIMRMGYRVSDKINAWKPAIRHFVEGDYSDISPNWSGTTGVRNSHLRHLAYQSASEITYSAPLRKFVLEMKDSVIQLPSRNAARALALSEVGQGEVLCPFIKLYAYFTTNGFPDFAPDWYESLRQNDDENGSQIEKQGEVDKYELLASAQNNNKNGKYAQLAEKYPNSVWVKNSYVTANSSQWQNSIPYVLNFIRKTSRLTGYNLTPYFEKWGYLRQVALKIDDYGSKWIILTPDMYEEFVEDMNALNLKTVSESMIKDISETPEMFQNTPVFPN